MTEQTPSVAQKIGEENADNPYGRRYVDARRGLFEKAPPICQYSIGFERFDLTIFDFRPDHTFESNIIGSFRTINYKTHFLSSPELLCVLLDQQAARYAVQIEGSDLQGFAVIWQREVPW